MLFGSLEPEVSMITVIQDAIKDVYDLYTVLKFLFSHEVTGSHSTAHRAFALGPVYPG